MNNLWYKPLSFDDFYGNKEVKDLVETIIKKPNVVLVTGKSGVGKTAFARLFAKKFSKSSIRDLQRMIMTGDDFYTEDIFFVKDIEVKEFNDDRIYIIEDAHYLGKNEQNKLLDAITALPNSLFIIVTVDKGYLSEEILSKVEYEFNITAPTVDEQVKLLEQLCKEKAILTKVNNFDAQIELLVHLRHGENKSIDFRSLVDEECLRQSMINLDLYLSENK